MTRFATALITTSLFLSGSALAGENWANKKGTVGIGAGASLAGTQGLEIRYNATPTLGFQAIYGFHSSGQSVDGGKSGVRQSSAGFGLSGVY